MSQRPKVLRSKRTIVGTFDQVNPNAAGIDAGSTEHWVSVPEDRTDQPVRKFGVFTEDLYELADWLVSCKIDTVAIEATGVYWIPLFEILERRGLNPRLVDARSIGRRNKKKTDVLDCQWIRQLHTFGLLDAAFRPDDQTIVLRSYLRHRRMLIEYASDHIRHMQKALDLMNLKLHTVISDITGATGQRIIRSILAGQRDPNMLAAMRDSKCKNSEETIEKALMGNYRDEHLFALAQAVELYDAYQGKLADCDGKISALLETFDKKADSASAPTRKKQSRRKNQPRFDGRSLLCQIAGIDLVAIDGLDTSSVLTIISETGLDMSNWPTHSHFTSWLGLCPNPWITGGKPIPRRRLTPAPNRAAQAFRLAAQTLERSQSAVGAFFRRIKARQGRKAAIKATAHKLARIFYAMLTHRTNYHDQGAKHYETQYRERLVKSLEKKALTLSLQLVPLEVVH
jgi:transposase